MPCIWVLVASILAGGLVWTFVAGSVCEAQEPLTLRGAWVWGKTCRDKASADAVLDRARLMRLNALYVLVFYWGGTACYRSDLVPMNPDVAEGFDPLGYLVEQGHAGGLEIHAWFVNGRNTRSSEAFKAHPDWMAMNLMGERVEWFDLCQEAVRDWQTRVMLEVLERYDVDGIHFDYIRFEGKDVCTCPVCRAQAGEEAGVDILALTYLTLPAYGHFNGNPLADPTTATVLARFNDWTPAVAVNGIGSGEAILFNWHAERNTPLAIHSAMRNALMRLGAKMGGPVMVLDSDINAAQYTHRPYQIGRDWVTEVGFQSVRITDSDLVKLSGRGVVFLPWHYLMPDGQAQALLAYVRNGGGALFLDGPVRTFNKNAAARELLGFGRSGSYFNEERLILIREAAGNFVPAGDHALSFGGEREKHRLWNQWRKDQITQLVAGVYAQAKRLKPDRFVTAAVFHSEAGADGVLQDWPRWVREGLLDYAIPMSYVETAAELAPAFDWWRTIDAGLTRIVPSVSLYKTGKDEGLPPAQHAARIAEQVQVCRDQGAHGVIFFSMEHIEAATAGIVGETVFNREVGDGSVLPGDFNGDRHVDFRDFILFATHYGASAGEARYDARYDLDGSGGIGFADFLRFARSYG